MDEDNYLILYACHLLCRNVINLIVFSQQPYKEGDTILTLNLKNSVLNLPSPKTHNSLIKPGIMEGKPGLV